MVKINFPISPTHTFPSSEHVGGGDAIYTFKLKAQSWYILLPFRCKHDIIGHRKFRSNRMKIMMRSMGYRSWPSHVSFFISLFLIKFCNLNIFVMLICFKHCNFKRTLDFYIFLSFFFGFYGRGLWGFNENWYRLW